MNLKENEFVDVESFVKSEIPEERRFDTFFTCIECSTKNYFDWPEKGYARVVCGECGNVIEEAKPVEIGEGDSNE